MAKTANAAPKQDTFFDLTFRGAVPEILRALAGRLERGEVTAEAITSVLTLDGRIELNLRLQIPKVG